MAGVTWIRTLASKKTRRVEPVVKVSGHGKYVMSLSPVPPPCREEMHAKLNLSRAETSSRWCGVVVRRGMRAQVSFTSLDHGSKLRGPLPKALV
ncbi:hypothetical protein TNCV_2327431 [Trichonephila clavipes]|nr:hypothetical protein TNCV_2327431 [Trichonephila clavipes]